MGLGFVLDAVLHRELYISLAYTLPRATLNKAIRISPYTSPSNRRFPWDR